MKGFESEIYTFFLEHLALNIHCVKDRFLSNNWSIFQAVMLVLMKSFISFPKQVIFKSICVNYFFTNSALKSNH